MWHLFLSISLPFSLSHPYTCPYLRCSSFFLIDTTLHQCVFQTGYSNDLASFISLFCCCCWYGCCLYFIFVCLFFLANFFSSLFTNSTSFLLVLCQCWPLTFLPLSLSLPPKKTTAGDPSFSSLFNIMTQNTHTHTSQFNIHIDSCVGICVSVYSPLYDARHEFNLRGTAWIITESECGWRAQ